MIKHYKNLLYYIQRMVGDKEQAIDIIQETYVKALEKANNIEIKNEKAFLYKIARNIVIDQARKNQIREIVTYEEEDFSIPKNEQPDEIVLENVKEELLLEALNNLPKHLKQVFVLHVFEGLEKKDIAKMMNLNLNTIQKYVINATAKLTEYIQEKNWE